MKILVISSLTSYHYNDKVSGGTEKCAEHMSQVLHDMGHYVDLYAYAAEEITKDYNFIKAGEFLNMTPGKRRNMVLHELKMLISKNEYDVIINNSARAWTICFELDRYFSHNEIKFVHIEHLSSEFNPSMGRFDQFAKMCKAHKLGHKVYMSAKHFIKEWPLALRNKHQFVAGRHGLSLKDVEAFTECDGHYCAATAEKETAIPSNGRAIFIGRVGKHKRPDFAAKLVKELGIKADFYVTFNEHDQDADKLMKTLRDIESEGHIKLHIERPRQDLLDAIRSAEFLIVTGLDTFCLVGFEAANVGVPTLFAIKDNLVSGLNMSYDYLTENNNFIIDTNRKKISDIATEVNTILPNIPRDLETRQKIADDLYAMYNIEECKKNLDFILKN